MIAGLILILFALIAFLVVIGLLVFYYIGAWKMYSKAGQAGWKSIIPFYNNWVLMVDICDMHIIYFILSLSISILSGFVSGIATVLLETDLAAVAYVFDIISWIMVIVSYGVNFAVYYNLGKKFNKGTGWVILTFFFGFITIPLLGYAKKNVYTDIEVSKHSLFGSIGK